MKKSFLLFILWLGAMNLTAQEDQSSALFKTLKSKDSLLFNIGFNTCDIKQFENLLSEHFEFYHDQAGITSSKQVFISGIKDGLCKLNYKPRRELVENSLEAYPLKKNGVLYGAVQTGVHHFYAIEKDQPEHLTSTAKFTHVWLLENGEWKLSRGLSYDHIEPINEKLLFKDRTETEKWMKEHRIPTLGIGYIHDGKISELNVYGKLETGGQEAPQNTIWNVASLTKPVTALVALKLVDKGEWNLDEPLSKYWIDPDIKDDPRLNKLTTRYVLSHQSGFANWRRQTGGKLAFEFDPGTKYQYSGEGYEYLRIALEKKFGKPLNQLADELVFKPIGMKDTRFFWDSSVDEKRFAKWHNGTGKVYETYKNSSPNAADDLLTTVEDYTKFMLYIMNGTGLSPDLYKQMISKQVKVKNNKYFGLGWSIDELENGEIAINHGGDDKGVHTIAFILPGSKEGLLIFTNCDNGTDIYIQTILAYLGKHGQDIINVETK